MFNQNDHNALFKQLGMPKPRTMFMGFGLWFFFSFVMMMAGIGVLGYVAWHFLSKVW